MLDFSILRQNQPIDIAGNFATGYKVGEAIKDRFHQSNALAALAQNPDDPNALAMLYQANPAVAARMEELNMRRHEEGRKVSSANALAAFILSPQGPPAPNGLTGVVPADVAVAPGSAAPEPNIGAPSVTGDASPAPDAAPAPGSSSPSEGVPAESASPEGAEPSAGDAAAAHADAWRNFVQADPEGAMKYLINRANLGKDQAGALGGQMDVIASLARGVTDQASYTAALQQAQQQGFDVSHLPAKYDPAVVDRIQRQALTASEHLSAIRQDRNVDSEIQTRNAEAQARQGTLEEMTRHHKAGEARAARSSPRPSAVKQPTPTTVIGGIMDKQARGEPLTPAEQQTITDYRASQHPTGRGRRGVSAGDGAVAVNPKTGEKVRLLNGQWVPVR